MITRVRTLTLAIVLTGLAGCSAAAPPQKTVRSEPAIRLSATLVSPTDITLEWNGQDPKAAGRIVEFATEPQGRYTILQFLPPNQTTFTHPDLIPLTPFYYRLRSFYGPASPSVEVSLPKGSFDKKTQNKDHSWLNPRAIPGGAAVKQSIRDPGTASAAAPADLRATIMHANGIKFTWTDRAKDEEGYLLEIRPVGDADFRVAAVLDPDITSFGLITLPQEKHSFFRVRAYYYGPPSNIAHQTTGADQKNH